MPKTAMAIAAHPDDIELMMAGTLLLLGEAEYDLHIMNIANGSCGSLIEDAETTAAHRTREAQAAAEVLGATFHPPIANDLEIFYEDELLRKLAATIRTVAPDIMLVQSPQDYMEDHTNACRLAVTAAFTRGMPNYLTDPSVSPIEKDVTLYHALPWGLKGPLGEPIEANLHVNIASTLTRKREALACHASQKEWLDQTQGLDSYLDTMEDMAREVGRASECFEAAEGWRRHLHLGFCGEDADPLIDALPEFISRKP
jgi:LmbE family N-acetylglucosaminyl deacetylase